MDLAHLGLTVDSRQVKTATDDLARLEHQGARTEGAAQRLESHFQKLTATLKGLGAALGIGFSFNQVLQNTLRQEQAVAQLNATLRSTQHAAGLSSKALQQMAADLQNVTTYGDEAIIEMQALLLTFTKIGGDVFPRAQKAILDVATAMGMDLKSAALQVGKALNDPVAGLSALSRSGIQFSAAQQQLIKDLVETGRVAEAQTHILRELEVQFGGSAEAARETLGGALKALSNAFGDLLEMEKGVTEPLRKSIETLAANLNVLVQAATAAAVVIGSRLVASLTAGAQALVASIAASRAHAVALAEEAARTAAATGAKAAYNAMLLAEAQAAVAAASGLSRLTLAQNTLIPAQTRAAAAAAAHTAALQAQTVAARNASIAATVLSRSLAFFGGPIGLAITGVAAAFYLLSTRQDEAASAADLAKQANDELNRVLGNTTGLTKEAAQAALDKADADLKQAEAALTAAKAEQEKFIAQSGGPAAASRLTGTGALSFSPQAQRIQALDDQVQALRASLEKAGVQLDSLLNTPGGGGGGGGLGGTGKALKDAQADAERFAAALESTIESLDPATRAANRYNATLETLNRALKDGLIDRERHTELERRARDELERAIPVNEDLLAALKEEQAMLKLTGRERAIAVELRKLDADATAEQIQQVRELAGANYDLQNATQGIIDQADPFADAWKHAIERVDGLFVDLWDSGLRGARSFMDAVKNTFRRMLAEMSHAAITRPIMVRMGVGGALGAGSGSAMAGGGGFGTGTGTGGGLSSLTNLISPLGTGLGTMASNTMAWGAQQLYSAGFETAANALGQSAVNIAGASNLSLGGGGLAGSLVGNFGANKLFGDDRGAGAGIGGAIGGTAGAIAGQVLIPIPFLGAAIGAAIGSFLGNGIGGLFGGKPSDKAQWGSIDLASGRTFDVAGQTGKKFSQENADARDTVLGAAGMLAQGLSELTGNVVDERIRVHIGSRDGLRLTVGDGREQNFGSDAERLLQATMNAVIDAATGIDAAWKRLVKGLKGTPEEILAALQALHNLDASLDALKGTGNGLAETVASLNGAVSSALDAFNQALSGGDAQQVIAAMDRAHAAVMARYQAEIQMATELYQRVLEISRAAQGFQIEVGSRINELAPSAELQNLLTGFLNQSLATAFDPALQPERQVEQLEEAMALLDQWVNVTRETIERNLETQVRGLEDERRLIEDTVRERLAGLQEELRIAQQWTQVLSSARRLIEQMTFTQANPLPTGARLNLATAEVERLQGEFQAASGEDRVSIGQELLKALETQLSLSQEMFQRPSPEYLDAYNAIIKQVSELEGVAQSEADRAAAIQQEISYLNDLQVEHLAAIDARIEALRASADSRLAEVNATALELYRTIQHQGNQAYEQLERQARDNLDVLLKGQSYDAFIADRQAEAVRLLEQIRDGVRAFAGVDGSHAGGLAYVPYDGYRAELHEGERVLTREEARQYREPVRLAPPRPAPAQGGDVAVTVNVQMPAITVSGEGGEQTAKDIMREIKRDLPAMITRGIKNAAPMIRRDILTN